MLHRHPPTQSLIVMTKTFIPGKDAALEETISHFRDHLSRAGFSLEETHWLNPIPGVWSVHLRDKDCPLCFSNGKGASQKAALASALGEYIERLSCNYFFADFWLGQPLAEAPFVHYPDEKWFPIPADNSLPQGLLDQHLIEQYDPQQELRASSLVDLQSGNAMRGICALPFVRQSDQQTVYIPMNIIGNLYVSNGMSAGNSCDEARVQALAEIFERQIKNRIIANAISLPEIPQAVLSRYPVTESAIAALRQQGLPVMAYDASLGGKYPVICVVLFNPANGSCFASFGAHPDFGVALERTVTELLQGRSLTDLDVFSPPVFDNEEVAEHTNLESHFIDSSGLISWDLFRQQADYAFSDWNFSGNTSQEFSNLLAILQQEGYEVYIADYQHLGADACRILVPGFSEIYPVDDLWFANNNTACNLRSELLALPGSQWDKMRYQQLLDRLDDEGYDDFSRIRELLGLACDPQSGWFTLRIGELKGMLALATGDWQQAQIWVEWTLDFNQSLLTPQRANYYRCLCHLLQAQQQPEPEQYHYAFSRMYGSDTLAAASAALQGKTVFYGLHASDGQLSGFPAHQALLQTYDKLQRAKADFWKTRR